MDIRGFIEFTVIDFPGVLACEVFTGGCNMRCPFCHNGHLVMAPENQPAKPEDEVFEFLESRRGLLEGIVVSGGEPTLQPDLLDFLAKAKDIGFATKVDTNGSKPDVVEQILSAELADMFAIDWKATLCKYHMATGVKRALGMYVVKSIELVIEAGIRLEVRTTAHRRTHSREDFASMRDELDRMGVGPWIIQPMSGAPVIDPFESTRGPYTVEDLQAIAEPLHDTRVRNA